MTAALTTPVSSTDSFGASITKIFQDPKVETAIGNGIGGVLNAGLGAIFGTGSDPNAAAAAAAAEEKRKAEQTTMLVVGGAAVLVVIVIVAVILHRSK